MTRIKIQKNGEVNVFEEGARIRLKKDIIINHQEGTSTVFVEKGEEGIISSVNPQIIIQFNEDETGVVKEISIHDDLLITDMAELLDGTHLRVMRSEHE